MHRDDAATGSKQLRDTLERHLLPSDLPAAKRGPRGAIGRMMEKAERFAPGAGKKHREKADADYAPLGGGGQRRTGRTGHGRAGSGAAAAGGGPASPVRDRALPDARQCSGRS